MRPDLIVFALSLLSAACVFAWLGVLVKRRMTRLVDELLNGLGIDYDVMK